MKITTALVVTGMTALAFSGCAEVAPDAPGAELEVIEDFALYPACGNEETQVHGETYWVFDPVDDDAFPEPVVMSVPGPLGFSPGLVTVAAPGPGDDVGTMVVYEGGFAHFTSDNGRLTAWLTTTDPGHQFVC